MNSAAARTVVDRVGTRARRRGNVRLRRGGRSLRARVHPRLARAGPLAGRQARGLGPGGVRGSVPALDLAPRRRAEKSPSGRGFFSRAIRTSSSSPRTGRAWRAGRRDSHRLRSRTAARPRVGPDPLGRSTEPGRNVFQPRRLSRLPRGRPFDRPSPAGRARAIARDARPDRNRRRPALLPGRCERRPDSHARQPEPRRPPLRRERRPDRHAGRRTRRNPLARVSSGRPHRPFGAVLRQPAPARVRLRRARRRRGAASPGLVDLPRRRGGARRALPRCHRRGVSRFGMAGRPERRLGPQGRRRPAPRHEPCGRSRTSAARRRNCFTAPATSRSSGSTP